MGGSDTHQGIHASLLHGLGACFLGIRVAESEHSWGISCVAMLAGHLRWARDNTASTLCRFMRPIKEMLIQVSPRLGVFISFLPYPRLLCSGPCLPGT